MIRTFEFAGELADEFTNQPLRFDADDWQTTFSAMTCVYPDFKARLRKFDEMVIMRRTGDNWEAVSQEQLTLTYGKADTIYIAAGTKGSAAMAAEYIATYFAEYGATAMAAAYAITYVAVSVAIAYASAQAMRALGGGGPSTSNKGVDKHASVLYNGAQNVIEQGGAIPLIYGRHRVGGTVIATELSTERMAQLMPDMITANVSATTTANVMSNDIARDFLSVTGWNMNGTSLAPGATYTDPSYTVSVASDGTVTITCGTVAGPSVSFTYTCTDSSNGSTPSATATIKFVDPNASEQTFTGGGDGSGGGSGGY